MNKLLISILGLTLFAALVLIAGCGGGSTTSGKSLVTVTVGDAGKKAALAIRPATTLVKTGLRLRRAWRSGLAVAAGVPAGVASIGITVSADGMDGIKRSILLSAGQQEISDTFEVPNGQARLFTVDAFNADGTASYRGSTTVDLNGSAVELPVSMTSLVPIIIIGTVTDRISGMALQGATVTFGSRPPVTTSLVGRYFVDLVPGTYLVTVSAPGYGAASVQNVPVNRLPSGGFLVIDLKVSQGFFNYSTSGL